MTSFKHRTYPNLVLAENLEREDCCSYAIIKSRDHRLLKRLEMTK